MNPSGIRPVLRTAFARAAFAVATFAVAVAASAEDDVLRAISYNVQFLPGPGRVVNKRKMPEYRAPAIGRAMAEFDIVGLNETFDDEPREAILAELRTAWGDDFHVAVHPRPEDSNRWNGGLLIASRRPILQSNHSYYTVYSDPKEFGVLADGFAAKGGLHARIARSKDAPDDFVDVFVTHLEARDGSLRPEQYRQFAAFIAEHSAPGRPALVMGDMNTRGNPDQQAKPDSRYREMIGRFEDARPWADTIDLWPALKGDALGGTSDQESIDVGGRIDYIIVSNPKEGGSRLEPTDVRVDPYPDEKVKFLSDHNAVVAVFTWRRNGAAR